MISTYVICIIYIDLKHKIGKANSIWKNEGLKTHSNSLHIISLTFQNIKNVRYTWTCVIFFDDWLIWNTLTNLKNYDYFKDFWDVHAGVPIARQRVVLKEKKTQQTTCFNSKASYQLMVDPFLHLTVKHLFQNWCFTKTIKEYSIKNKRCFLSGKKSYDENH